MPIVFRDFGTVNPWALDYSLDRGPKSNGVDSGFNATIFCDFGVPAEFRRLLICDTTVAAASSITLYRDFAAPHVTVTAFSVDMVSPGEYGLSARVDTINLVDSPALRILNGDVPIQFLQTILRDNLTPLDESRNFILDVGNSTEWRSAIFADNDAPEFFILSITCSAIVPSYWLSTSVRDDTSSMNVAATGQIDNVAPVVWTAPTISETPITTSWVAQTVIDSNSLFECGAGRLRDDASVSGINLIAIGSTFVPAEWGGAIILFEDVLSGVEFKSESAISTASTVGWITTSRVDVGTDAEWTTSLVPIDYAMLLSWGSSVAAWNEVSADWSAPAIVDFAISFDFLGVLAMVYNDANVPLEFGSETFVDTAAMGIDWLLTFATRHMKGATIDVPNTTERKPVAEGSGTKGATLGR